MRANVGAESHWLCSADTRPICMLILTNALNLYFAGKKEYQRNLRLSAICLTSVGYCTTGVKASVLVCGTGPVDGNVGKWTPKLDARSASGR